MDFIIKNGVLEEYRGSAEDVHIPEGVTKIASWFCNEPARVRRLRLPQSLTRIDDCNFIALKNLEYVYIPSSVRSIGRCAFSDCAKLKHIEIENPNTEIALWAFDGTKYESDMLQSKGALILGSTLVKASKEVDKYIVPSHVKIIGRDAFKNAKIKEVIVPHGVTKLDICAFAYSSLERISLPDTLKTIEAYAFSNCTSLTELTIPKSVTRIGDCAFEELPNCVLTILNGHDDEEIFRFAQCSFGMHTPNIKEVHVPYGSAAMRYAKEYGLNVTAHPCAPAKFGNPKKYRYIDDMFCCEGSILHEYFGHQETVHVPDGISVIGSNAFTNADVKRVYLPKSVKLIEKFAFSSCEDLIEVEGEGAQEIEPKAFSNCKNLQRAEFPQLEKYVDIAFVGCDSLLPENMLFPESAVAVRTHWRTCSCLGSKLIEGKIHAGATTVIDE